MTRIEILAEIQKIQDENYNNSKQSYDSSDVFEFNMYQVQATKSRLNDLYAELEAI